MTASSGSPPRAWGQRPEAGRAGPHTGSPPRAWGQPREGAVGPLHRRFTPTCVGTTTRQASESLPTPVHPHVRGDNSRNPRFLSCLVGSPPRAWGQPSPCACLPQRNPVHPHVRGDNFRPRGGGVEDVRFTPTCVGTTRRGASRRASPPVHPHVRGDNAAARVFDTRCCGSPPRAWGQPGRWRSRRSGPRFTPTCVGTTPVACSTRLRPSVHPHVRGDNPVDGDLDDPGRGSPPRAWGQRWFRASRRRRPRFTPTCVGTTGPARPEDLLGTVHPHVRGDNPHKPVPVLPRDGSPPRAWGQPLDAPVLEVAIRFTPTCVGTTAWAASVSAASSVHPHVRGDNSSLVRVSTAISGSPPRAWGQLPRSSRRPSRLRFTPTCVGTTEEAGEVEDAIPVHPHVRGDNLTTPQDFPAFFGSPPRAWGQPHDGDTQDEADRFTPTCVGTTPPDPFVFVRWSVHPHVRGDNAAERQRLVGVDGSPPRAWGQPREVRLRPRRRRFTPTCVGTTSGRRSPGRCWPVHPHVRGDNLRTFPKYRSRAGSPPRAWGQLAGQGLDLRPPRFTPTCVGTTGGRTPRG